MRIFFGNGIWINVVIFVKYVFWLRCWSCLMFGLMDVNRCMGVSVYVFFGLRLMVNLLRLICWFVGFEMMFSMCLKRVDCFVICLWNRVIFLLVVGCVCNW